MILHIGFIPDMRKVELAQVSCIFATESLIAF